MIYGGCNCGNCHLTILPTGDLYACRRVQNSKVGNVFEDRIADVWVCESVRWKPIGIIRNSRNARNVSCWSGVGDALPWPAVRTGISMTLTPNAGKRWSNPQIPGQADFKD